MPYFLTEEQLLIQANIREFVQKEIKPRAHLMDDEVESVKLARDVGRGLAALGVTTFMLPESMGGMGGDKVLQAIIVEEVSKESPPLGIMSLSRSSNALACLAFPKMKEKYFDKAVAGEFLIGRAFTDPVGVTNFGEWPEMGVLEGDEWVINGSKNFVTYAPIADAFLVSGLVKDDLYNWWMDKDTPGLSITPDPKCGMGRYDYATINLKNVRLPLDQGAPWDLIKNRKIKPDNEGFHGYTPALIVAVQVGLAQGVLDKTVEYLKVRTRYGKPIASLQAVQHQLAKMQTEIDVARTFVYAACRLRQQGKTNWLMDHEVKAWVGEMPVDIARNCVRLHGSIGYSVASGIERYYRDALGLTLGEMSTELRYDSIAYCMGLPGAEPGAF